VTIPHDLDAEQALLGDLLALPNRISEVAATVAASDFYKPQHGYVYAAILDLSDAGQRVDAYTVVDQMRRSGTATDDTARFVGELASAGAGGYRRYAEIVAGHALRRKVLSACAELVDEARRGVGDAADLLDKARDLLAGIDVPAGDLPADFHDFDTWLDRGIESRSPWVIPGLLRQDWRAILVAGEGVGKSVVLRSFALMAAQGVHPFAHTKFDRARTLLVDLENPDDALAASCAPIREQARRIGVYEPGRAWLWHRPGGINIRSRSDRATFDAILTAAKPDLVCMGPLYKLYRRNGSESDEQAAEACQQALDDLRTRHKFALLMEHHAPKGLAGNRDMTPYGSSYWLRWPEIGIGLVPEDGKLMLKRWRGDRLPTSWPEWIARDHGWPWRGRTVDGVPGEEAA
jgi:hypothetical protein